MRLRLAFGLATLVLITAGCSSTAPTPAPTASTARVSTPDTTGQAEREAAFWARRNADRQRFTQADVDFMTGMIGHHAQALIMAAMAPTHGASPELQTLAARIDNAQKAEIAMMQNWLRIRGQPVPEVHIEGTHLMIHGPGGHMNHGDHMMPGMLTQAQLDELDAARGPEFDRLFLTYMIGHHSGAVTMVEDLFATDGGAQEDDAFKLASDIQVDQRTEIARMHRMLDARSAD